jgi:hypothetical protein
VNYHSENHIGSSYPYTTSVTRTILDQFGTSKSEMIGTVIDPGYNTSDGEIENILSTLGTIISVSNDITSNRIYVTSERPVYGYDVKSYDGYPVYVYSTGKDYEPSGIEPGVMLEIKLTYKDYYWAYVNSTSLTEGWENFDKMLECVTEDMQPAKGMNSWVDDPKPAKQVTELKHPGGWTTMSVAFVVIALGFMVALTILQLAFGITL